MSLNVYDVLDNDVDESDEEPALPLNDTDVSDEEDPLMRDELERGAFLLKQLHDSVELEVCRNEWCHPGPTKRREILGSRWL